MTLFPRLHAAIRERNRALTERRLARVQRDHLREQRDRAYAAIGQVAYQWSALPIRGADQAKLLAVQDALNRAVALQRAGTEYDRVQLLTDPSYESTLITIQENTP